MRDGSIVDCIGKMVEVGSKGKPLEDYRQQSARHLVCFRLTATSNAGNAATTAAVKTKVMMSGGLLGSVLNMWWISSSFPYRSGFSWDGRGEAGSCAMVRSKARLLYGLDEPKDAMIKDAERGADEESKGIGMSFCV